MINTTRTIFLDVFCGILPSKLRTIPESVYGSDYGYCAAYIYRVSFIGGFKVIIKIYVKLQQKATRFWSPKTLAKFNHCRRDNYLKELRTTHHHHGSYVSQIILTSCQNIKQTLRNNFAFNSTSKQVGESNSSGNDTPWYKFRVALIN